MGAICGIFELVMEEFAKILTEYFKSLRNVSGDRATLLLIKSYNGYKK